MTEAAELLQVIDLEGRTKGKAPNLKPEDWKAIFRAMLATRLFDQRGMNLQRQGRIGFFVPSSGQEASQVGAGYAAAPEDWIFPSYRTHSIAILKGVTFKRLLDQCWGNGADATKGRQMPNHFSFKDVNWVSISSPIGTQITHAAGAARAMQIRGEKKAVWVWFGDGGTSANDFHAGLNFAGVWKSPCIFMCENNHWAISVPQEKQTASATFAEKAIAYGMRGVRVDGNDVLAVYQAAKEARERALAGEGPTLIESVTFRMGPHSSSDDPKRYQAQSLFEAWQKKDPIERFRAWLKAKKAWTQGWEDDLSKSIQDEISKAVDAAEASPPPAIETLFDDVYATLPQMLEEQKAALLEQIKRSGDIENAGGAFPL